jgi:putative ABC transport system permease protein
MTKRMPQSKAPPQRQDPFPQESLSARALRELETALESLFRSPHYSLPAVVSLALGLGASLAMFAVFNGLMLRPLAFPEEDRLVRVGFPGAGEFSGPDELMLSPPLVARLRQYKTVFAALTSQGQSGSRLQFEAQPAAWTAAEKVELDYFDTLQVRAVRGKLFSTTEPASAQSVVLRQSYWEKDLQARPQIGDTVIVDGVPKTFSGVVADEQALPAWGGVWDPVRIDDPNISHHFYYQTFARLVPGLTLEQAQAALLDLTADLDIKNALGSPVKIRLRPLREILVSTEQSWLSLMLAAVGSFLLMSCANLGALAATRAATRKHDCAVQAALGATRWELARQGVIEGFLLAAGSGLLGLLLAHFGVAWANQQYTEVLTNTPARIDGRVLAALLALVLTCTLVGSVAPVFVLRQVTPIEALRGAGRASQSQAARRLRQTWVIVQVAATVLLLLNAGLLVRSLQALLRVDPGFNSDHVVAAKVVLNAPPHQNTRETFFAQKEEVERQGRIALARARELEGVVSVGVGRLPFDYASERLRMELEPGALKHDVQVRLHGISADYFETLGISQLSGQPFGPEHETWPPQRFAIVSRNFAEQALGVPDAVGHRLRFLVQPEQEVPWMQIIGMVEDTLEAPLTDPAPYNVYISYFAYPNRSANDGNTLLALSLKVNTEPELVMSHLPSALAEVLPTAPVTEIQSLQSLVDGSLKRRSALAQVLSVLAGIALLLAAVGLAGVASYSAAQRTQELAIRRALGATGRGIQVSIFIETGYLVVCGLAVGAGAAWFSRRLMAAFLTGISPLDAVTYLGVLTTAALITALATWVASRPLGNATPARALQGR